jgi:hypothetical protein
MWFTLERGNVCLQTESVDCRQTLPRSKVDHLDTNHRMQKYRGKTDNQDTKRRVWTVFASYDLYPGDLP